MRLGLFDGRRCCEALAVPGEPSDQQVTRDLLAKTMAFQDLWVRGRQSAVHDARSQIIGLSDLIRQLLEVPDLGREAQSRRSIGKSARDP
ncbi:hypothetical protein D3C86_2056010 [compost metagenome]